MQLSVTTRDGLRPATADDKALARGGEGSIHRLVASEPVVLKRYHETVLASRGPELEAKVLAMVKNTPHSSDLCWPLSAAYEGNRFVGYVMREVDVDSSLSWAALSNAASRRAKAPNFGVAHALRACTNAAAALAAAHAVGVVLGDVNESNLLVYSDARVVVVDCDSAQVRDGAEVHHCTVGKADYTAPELVGQRFVDTLRTPATDIFAFAILVFQMLIGGAHPFDGVPVNPDQDLAPIQERILGDLTPYFSPAARSLLSAPPRVPFDALDSRLRSVLAASLSPDPKVRPSATQWHQTLSAIDVELRGCPVVPTHAFTGANCGWCAHRAKAGSDPFGPLPPRQVPLEPVDFTRQPPTTAVLSRVSATTSPAGTPASPSSPATGPYGSQSSIGSNSTPSTPQTSVYTGTWTSLVLKHPSAVARHFIERYRLLGALAAHLPKKKASALAIYPAAAAAALVFWIAALFALRSFEHHGLGGSPQVLRVLLSYALLASVACALLLAGLWVTTTARYFGGLRANASIANALRLALCAGPLGLLLCAGIIVALAARLIGGLITALVRHW